MWPTIRNFLTRSRLLTKLALAVAVIAIGFGVLGHRQTSMANTNIMDRLQMLRSTSPESGVRYADSAMYDVSAADALLSDLHTMSSTCAMAAQSPDPELSAAAMEWSKDLEANEGELVALRRSLVETRIRSLQSTSPESGAQQ